MKLLFKQRFFSWFDSYDVYNEYGERAFTIKGQLAWGHCLKIFDARGEEVATVKERILTFLPEFELYIGEKKVGCISKELAFFRQKFSIDFNGWTVDGDWTGWDYTIYNDAGRKIAQVSKELLNWTDTYVIDIENSQDALCALMLVIAIDAEKCSSHN